MSGYCDESNFNYGYIEDVDDSTKIFKKSEKDR